MAAELDGPVHLQGAGVTRRGEHALGAGILTLVEDGAHRAAGCSTSNPAIGAGANTPSPSSSATAMPLGRRRAMHERHLDRAGPARSPGHCIIWIGGALPLDLLAAQQAPQGPDVLGDAAPTGAVAGRTSSGR